MATYEIYYTETAEQDILEKFSYILHQFRDPTLAETWYTRLREVIQSNLSQFPEKYPLYNVCLLYTSMFVCTIPFFVVGNE